MITSERGRIDALMRQIHERGQKKEPTTEDPIGDELPSGVLAQPAHPNNPWRGMDEAGMQYLREFMEGTEIE